MRSYFSKLFKTKQLPEPPQQREDETTVEEEWVVVYDEESNSTEHADFIPTLVAVTKTTQEIITETQTPNLGEARLIASNCLHFQSNTPSEYEAGDLSTYLSNGGSDYLETIEPVMINDTWKTLIKDANSTDVGHSAVQESHIGGADEEIVNDNSPNPDFLDEEEDHGRKQLLAAIAVLEHLEHNGEVVVEIPRNSRCNNTASKWQCEKKSSITRYSMPCVNNQARFLQSQGLRSKELKPTKKRRQSLAQKRR